MVFPLDGKRHKDYRYIEEYNKAHYESLRIRVPTGRRKAIQAYAEGQGLTVNSFVTGLIRGAMGLTEDEWTASEGSTDKGQDKRGE